MLIFWLLCALMLLVALAMVLGPIVRPRISVGVSPYDASVATHRQNLKNLEQQQINGILDAEGFQQAREELEFTLLKETEGQESDPAPAPARPAKFTAVMLLILVPALSLGLYAWLGNYPALQILVDPQALQSLRDQHPTNLEEVARQVNNLKRRVRQAPTDIQAWEDLATGQMTLEQYIDATKTLDHLIRQYGETPERLLNYAEATSITHQMQFNPLALQRLERALVLVPEHPKALMMGALAALQNGNKKLALERWQNLLVMQQPGSETARVISALITRTEQSLNQVPAAPASGDNSNIASPRINVALSLSPALQKKVTGRERVFVFARAVGGTPMPLAVKILNASDLPASVVLGDDNAMPSGPGLSSAGQVQIGARISFSGSATPTAGDLEGHSEPLRAQDNPSLNLVIDRVRP